MLNRNEEDVTIARVVQANDRRLAGQKVRLVDENSEQVGLVDFQDAIEKARKAELDLVLVAPKANPPVCRIMDYGKYQYEKKKRERESRKQQAKQKLKEVQFHANIENHDYQTKVNHIIAFLKKGNKVRVSLFFRGREMAHKEYGYQLINQVIEDIQEEGAPDAKPKWQGKRQLSVVLSPYSAK